MMGLASLIACLFAPPTAFLLPDAGATHAAKWFGQNESGVSAIGWGGCCLGLPGLAGLLAYPNSRFPRPDGLPSSSAQVSYAAGWRCQAEGGVAEASCGGAVVPTRTTPRYILNDGAEDL